MLTFLREVEQKLKPLLDSIGEGVLVADERGTALIWNATAERILGVATLRPRGGGWGQRPGVFAGDGITPIPGKDRPLLRAIRGELVDEEEIAIRSQRGDLVFVNCTARPLRDPTQRIVGAVAIFREVTERRRMDEERDLHAAVVASISEGICLVRASDRTILYANPKFARMLSYDDGELEGKPASILRPETPNASARDAIERTAQQLREKGVAVEEIINVCKDGRLIRCRAMSTSLQNREHGEVWVVVKEDITERQRLEAERDEAQEALKTSLAEKEILLKEMDHRVKNNLQVISSLLKLQADQMTDPVAKGAFQDSQDRVAAIALLHEKLYHSKNLGSVSMAEYGATLLQILLRTYGTVAPARVSMDADGIYLPAHTALPCGLILNELVTNALKHAFPANRATTAEIKIAMTRDGTQMALSVNDNGVGLSADFDMTRSHTLGMHLVRTLARQLRADVHLATASGTRWLIRFPQHP